MPARSVAAIGLAMALSLAAPAMSQAQVAPADAPFEDGLFRRCIAWLMTGEGGALIDNLCEARYAIPSPSMFICARKTIAGFESTTDREVCAVIFDEQAKKARAGRVN